MFRREEVSKLIKKCNDFGAGGVSVAIGELADGLQINLDKVPKKYAGLDGTEIAISESQERMAVVVDPKDVDEFLGYAKEENLEAVKVAVVTEDPRLVLSWRGKEIVNISRAFLNTNGAHQETTVKVDIPSREDTILKKQVEVGDVKEKWLDTLKDLNVCSQKGLVEMFDGSIGAGSVFMPHGGKYQMTETQSMVAKLPVMHGKCDTVTMMSYGFDPYLSSWSPYHGAVYAVTESMAKIVACGGDYSKIRFTFQEYFRRMTEDPERWSQPFAALLGAYKAQIAYGLPSIGGKDSMSGTFEHIDVPPTLVSFAVDIAKEGDIITPELKKAGNKLVWMKIEKDEYELPVYEQVMDQYGKFADDIHNGKIVSAYALDRHGVIAAVSKMAFGNGMGVKIEHSMDARELFAPAFGDIVAEVPADKVGELSISYTVIGEVTDDAKFAFGDTEITLKEAEDAWTGTLEQVFRTVSDEASDEKVESPLYDTKDIVICGHKIAQPTVFIPVFPGTNCEYDSAKAFERAGAKVITKVFRNMDAADIVDSVNTFEKEIANINTMSPDELKELIESGRYVPSYMWNQNGWLCSKMNLHIISQTQKCYPTTHSEDLFSTTLNATIKAGDPTGMRAVVTTETEEGITLVTECVGKVFAPDEFDRNDWTFIGEPETTVSVNRPATVEMTCATIVNRIPQLIDAPAGYVTTDKYPYNEYCVHALNTYVRSK